MGDFFRYKRQFILPPIGTEGQRRLGRSVVAVVGLGALGSVSANLLVRAGVGRIRLIDRDFLELNNLQRQVLYDEEDVYQNLPKAVAAFRKLRKINSEIEIEPEAADVNADTIHELLEEVHLVIDGTDNFETRFLLNDFALAKKIPWIYGGAVGTEGLTYVILPGEGPCLRCLFEEVPPVGEFRTCDTAGILASASHWVANFQVVEAMKILVGRKEEVDRRLWKADLWRKEFKAINVSSAYEKPCSGCERGDYPYLGRERGSRTVTLCGRNAVQIFQSDTSAVNFQSLAKKLSSEGNVKYNEYLLKASIAAYEITVFSNGRAIIQGTEDAAQAKAIYSKYIGG